MTMTGSGWDKTERIVLVHKSQEPHTLLKKTEHILASTVVKKKYGDS